MSLVSEKFDKPYRQRVHRRDVHLKVDKKTAEQLLTKTVVCQSCGKLVRECYYETHLANHHGFVNKLSHDSALLQFKCSFSILKQWKCSIFVH